MWGTQLTITKLAVWTSVVCKINTFKINLWFFLPSQSIPLITKITAFLFYLLFKSCGVTIHLKPFWQNFYTVLFYFLGFLRKEISERGSIIIFIEVVNDHPPPININTFFSLKAKLWLRGGGGGRLTSNLNWSTLKGLLNRLL